jgi:6-phosphogluconolactonase (cycloisomerase 2 family)
MNLLSVLGGEIARAEGGGMTTEQRIVLSRRSTLGAIIRLIPAIVIAAVMLNSAACNPTGLLGTSSGGNGVVSPTATPTAGTGALAFVTNFNDGMVSSFTRNTSTGVLKRSGQMTAGANKGPKGVVVAPSGSFLYVANNKDDNIYQFAVSSTDGTLTPLSPKSISNGKNSGPDELAINDAGTFLWVTGAGNGTAGSGSVTTYGVNSSTGQLTKNSKVSGLSSAFGIAVDQTNSIVYVSDHGAGLVYSFSIGKNGGLTQIGSPVQDIGGPGGKPGFIAIDPGFNFIYVTDLSFGVLSTISTTDGALAFGSILPSTAMATVPIGVGYASISGSSNFLFTANQGDSTLWSFQVTSPGNPTSPVAFGNGEVSAPTGLVVDPQNAFLYTTDQTAGTVSQFSLKPTCSGVAGPPCFVQSVATENPASSTSGPFQIILAP